MRVARYAGSDFAGDEVWAVTLRPSHTSRDEQPVTDHLARLDDALSVTYHELGNAIAGISAGLNLLRETWDDLDDAQRRARLDRIERASTGTAMHLKSYLDASRIESGVFEPRPVANVLLDLVLEHLPDLGVHAGDVVVEIPDDVTVDINDTHLWSIVGNFIRNALKHAAPPIVVSATNLGAQTLIAVSDHGPGVPTDRVAGLFERFGHTGDADHTSSNGLGLWIAGTMAAAYGGSVWHEPNTPQGSRFCVKLPAAKPSSARKPQDALPGDVAQDLGGATGDRETAGVEHLPDVGRQLG